MNKWQLSRAADPFTIPEQTTSVSVADSSMSGRRAETVIQEIGMGAFHPASVAPARIALDEVTAFGGGLARPECVLATRAGDLYVSDRSGGIRHLRPDGSGEVIGGSPEVIPNGFAMTRDGNFIVANLADDGGVWEIRRDGTTQALIQEIDGVSLPSVNFVWLDAQERLWICVSTVRRGDHQFRRDIADGFIAVRDAQGTRIVADNIHWTNECRTDPTGKYLYVNETFGRRTLRFTIGADASLANRKVLTSYGEGTYPDGMAIDEDGGIWVVSVVSNRLIHVSPQGHQTIVLEDLDPAHVARLETEFMANRLSRPLVYDNHSTKLKNITSLAFGGPDLRTAYLGSINDDRLAVFTAPVAGLKPVHWDW